MTELYAAADAGVDVEIFARTTCTLWPRRRGGKEDIKVRTLLGRFFEHSRFFIFEADGESTFLMGSADLMRRNLDHRIEILVPVEDARSQRELSRTFDSIMEDTRWSWALRADGSWERVTRQEGELGPEPPQRADAARPRPGKACEHRFPRALIRQPTRWEQWSACESRSSTWARTRFACSSPSLTAVGCCPCTRRRSSSASARRSSATATSAPAKCAAGGRGRARPDAQGAAARLRADRDPRHLARPPERATATSSPTRSRAAPACRCGS